MFIFTICVKILKQGRCKSQEQNTEILARVAKFRSKRKILHRRKFRTVAKFRNPIVATRTKALQEEDKAGIVQFKKNLYIYIYFKKKYFLLFIYLYI